MKKSIVLLISLFFITALSVLILKNLEDTNTYLSSNNHKINKIQVLTSINNTQQEISKIFIENKKYIDDIVSELNGTYIPINIKDLSLQFSLRDYDRVDLNLLSSKDSKKYKHIEELFGEYDIFDFDTFKYTYTTTESQYKNNNSVNDNFINNNKQIADIIDIYIKETTNNKILEIKERLGFLHNDENTKLYELFIKINYLNDFSKAYYVLDGKGVVKYFESSFK
jgi:hypothetical protein